jgi:hypothetical protein
VLAAATATTYGRIYAEHQSSTPVWLIPLLISLAALLLLGALHAFYRYGWTGLEESPVP